MDRSFDYLVKSPSGVALAVGALLLVGAFIIVGGLFMRLEMQHQRERLRKKESSED